MQKKHILVLSLLAAGIAIELILMAGLMTVRGNNEQTLSTNPTSIAWGENNNNPTGAPGAESLLPAEGYPVLDEDMLGAMPEAGEEATPIFLPTLEGDGTDGSFGNPFGDSFGDGYPVPGDNFFGDFGGGGSGGGFSFPDDDNGTSNSGTGGDPFQDYPAPPTLPAGPQEPWPTDVPAETEVPTSAPTETAAAPTATQPAPEQPTQTLPVEPTHTLPVDFPPDAAIPTYTPAPPDPSQTAAPTATAPAAATATGTNADIPTATAATATAATATAATATAATATVAATSAATATPTPAATGADSTVSGLVSVPADAPALDGSGGDAAWASAPAVDINVSGGANHGSTRITARSVYSDGSVYFLFTWEDPTQSFVRLPWERQADGSWKILKSPNSGLNDENVYYEDKLALLWPVRGMNDFSASGCGTACHTGENADAKPYGNMYTPGEDSRADLWQWKSVRNAGQVDDEYMDSTRYSADAPAAGVHPDPNDGGGYRANQNKDKNAPAYMPRDGGQKNGAPGFITEEDKVDLDPRLFKPGERVPSVLVAPWKGDRGSIQAAWQYKDGRWTLELRRKLMTGSPYDVQFDDPDKVYSFGIAAFDNAQVRHAYQSGATSFRFRR